MRPLSDAELSLDTEMLVIVVGLDTRSDLNGCLATTVAEHGERWVIEVQPTNVHIRVLPSKLVVVDPSRLVQLQDVQSTWK